MASLLSYQRFNSTARGAARPPRRGYTLVELLFSVLILAIGLVALSQLYLVAMTTTRKGRYISLATQRAQYELEKAQNLGYKLLDQGSLISNARYPSDEYTALASGRGVSFTERSLPNGRGTVTISKYKEGSSTINNVIQVDIRVLWDDQRAGSTEVNISTLKTGPTSASSGGTP